MPTRDERTGFLLYEATEGGAGVLTRLVAEPERLAEVARKALAIMHFAVTDAASVPTDSEGLAETPDNSCVAACYRCLMSYFNQPDHEHIDRRNAATRTLLVRLARAVTSGLDGSPRSRRSPRPSGPPGSDDRLALFRDMARVRELPDADTEPVAGGDAKVRLIWRSHYVAVLLEASAASEGSQLEDKGFEVITLGSDPASWPASLDRLARALGRTS